MDTVLQRLNIIACTFFVLLSIASVGNSLAPFTSRFSPQGNVKLNNVMDLFVHQGLEADQGNLGLDISTDLEGTFQWNAKQLFAFVSAKYTTPRSKRSEVVVWDAIIQNTDQAKIALENKFNKYSLRDKYKHLQARNITLSLDYQYIPVVGYLQEFNVATSDFTMPSTYFRNSARMPSAVPVQNKEEEESFEEFTSDESTSDAA